MPIPMLPAKMKVPKMLHSSETLTRRLQRQFTEGIPITHRPFQEIAQKYGIGEPECIERFQEYRQKNICSGIRAKFDGPALGYDCALLAMRVADDKCEFAVEQLTGYPGTTRCELRDDAYNLWTTVLVDPNDTLEHVIKVLHKLAGAEHTLALPTMSVYKVSDIYRVTGEEDWLGGPGSSAESVQPAVMRPSLDKKDIALIRTLQEDLPLVEMPFALIAAQVGLKEKQLFERIGSLEQRGLLLSFRSEPAHKRPLKEYAAVTWKIPDGRIDAVGRQLARMRQVTHCLRKPVYPDWDYPLYSILHGVDAKALQDNYRAVAGRLGNPSSRMLKPLKIYPSAPVRYFPENLSLWWKQAESWFRPAKRR